MARKCEPAIGDWYRSLGGDYFEVVALDMEDGTVEIQHADGAIEELDLETWLDLELLPADPPEWAAESLDLAREDYQTDQDWSPEVIHGNPLDLMDFDR